MARKTTKSQGSSLFWRILPALGFILALSVLVVAVYDTSYSALPPAEKRYTAAKEGVSALKADEKRSAHRDQWLKLADEFFSIYQLDPQWPNRPAALYLAAETMEELASRSFAARDYKLAVDRYEQVALKHATSRLADDALYRAAIIRAEYMKDTKGALQLLKRIRTQYPRGDMLAKATELEKALLQDGNVPKSAVPSAGLADTGNSTAPQTVKPTEKAGINPNAADKSSADKNSATSSASLTQVSWTSLDKNRVRIVVELDRDADWKARMLEADKEKGLPARLVLDMTNTVPVTQVQPGARVKDSLLTRVRVDHQKVTKSKPDTTRVYFDFSDARRYDTQVEQDPFRIILTVAAGRASLPKGLGARVGFAETAQPSPEAAGTIVERKTPKPAAPQKADAEEPTSRPSLTRAASAGGSMTGGSMAEQLGLTVQTVFIDAGHGGKDPGTVHNDIVERDIALDISRRLGRLLEANGFDVEYSRTKDVSVALSSRSRVANTKKADLFVSIHVNAHQDPSFSGFEAYYLDLASNTQAARVATLENAASDRKLGDMQSVMADIMLNARTQESRRLAQDIRRVTLSRVERRGFSLKDGGAKAAPFHVLIGAGMPAVLVEVGYCTNIQEARRLTNPTYRHAMAEGLAEGIMAYRDRLKQRNSAETVLTPKSESAMRLFRDF